MKKPILVSGLQPSGRLHIGNYLGTLKNCVDLQNAGDYQCYFFIADLHSITENFDPNEKRQQIINLAADFLAAGIDPKKSTVFLQSLIPAHSELAWILNTVTPMGDLERMTQFKDKSERQDANVNVGLFDYPVLMTADVLLYDAIYVPVGDDQSQHIELMRTLARKFNAKFGDTLFEPKALFTKTTRVMSLKDPRKKMSKSQPEGCLLIDDAPEDIKKKIAGAVTDSDAEIRYDRDKKSGLANLIDIYAALQDVKPESVAAEFKGGTYASFKDSLAKLISDYFAEFREKKQSLMANPQTLIEILKSGSESAREVAEKKMDEVRKKIGLAL